MKQNRLIPALLLFLLLCACRQGHFPFSAANYNPPSYISSIDKEDCYLCSENHREHLLWACWEQDNLGIVNLNTFDVYPVRINNYGRDGRQIKEPLGYTEIINVSLGEVRLSSTTDPDRGYSRIGIPPENTAVEPDLVGTFLCQDCLDAFASHLCQRRTVRGCCNKLLHAGNSPACGNLYLVYLRKLWRGLQLSGGRGN